MRIEPGRLIERECPGCGRTERRAFGESESSRGELASYAFGWTAGHGDPVARMTIGIGAGNPGGGTFHVDLRIDATRWVMGLVDEPFEDVPEGGPDLTADEARAHGDLKYVWLVAEEVLAQDRRAWWMEHWLRATRSFVTQPVLDGSEPVRSVVHDDDEDWQLLCGTVDADDPKLFHLHHALDRDPSLLEVLDLEPGERADRDEPGDPWERGPA
jgi:hypothetical protein